MYRPNFCAECGERVVRERWRAWASRRFCAVCERRLGRGWARLAAALCLCACAGFAAGRLLRPPAPPLVVERRTLPTPALLAKPDTSPPSDSRPPAPPTTGGGVAPQTTGGGAAGEPPTDPAEVVSVCGARTQKGTPCSRRVRGVGRCWQHRGRPAMLPAARLVVRDD